MKLRTPIASRLLSRLEESATYAMLTQTLASSCRRVLCSLPLSKLLWFVRIKSGLCPNSRAKLASRLISMISHQFEGLQSPPVSVGDRDYLCLRLKVSTRNRLAMMAYRL